MGRLSGAKYTTSKGKGWKHICIINGFQTKIESMQFEWALKHMPPRNAGGMTNRIKLIQLFHKRKMDNKITTSKNIILTLHWRDKSYRPENIQLPDYIKETFN